jgi:hypothetical protein
MKSVLASMANAHGGHLVEEVRFNQLQSGHEQFGSYDQGHGATEKEHHQG